MALLRSERAEVDLGKGFLDQAPALGLAQGATNDLLGREQREIGDLILDLVDRLARLGRDRRLGCRDVALALLGGLLAHLALELHAGAARSLDDLASLAARLGELLLVLLQQPLGLVARVLRGLEVLAHDRAALLDERRERSE